MENNIDNNKNNLFEWFLEHFSIDEYIRKTSINNATYKLKERSLYEK